MDESGMKVRKHGAFVRERFGTTWYSRKVKPKRGRMSKKLLLSLMDFTFG